MVDLLVVDSCVWGHAQNTNDKYFECASKFLQLLDDAEQVSIVVDDGELILTEYESQIKDPSYPQELLARLLDSGRTTTVRLGDLHADLRTLVNKVIKPSKPRDRTLLIVTLLSECPLVSDDFEDFHPRVRAALKKKAALIIVDSCEGCGILESA